jgi:maltose O-acetyltransferase
MTDMTDEEGKMLAGELYLASAPDLVAKRAHARELTRRYNGTSPLELAARRRLLIELLADVGDDVEVEPPFHCDYGTQLVIGASVYINVGCVVLDCARVVIGDRALLGPGVHIYAATHPVDPSVRRSGRELAAPVSIGTDVWLGGGVIVCPGVTIGAGTTIGAGSVVTRDIPPGVVAAGNPCRILRTLDSAAARTSPS